MKKIMLFISIFISMRTIACLNLFAVDANGNFHLLEHHFIHRIEFHQKEIAKKLSALEKEFAANKFTYQKISDYGAFLLMAGRFTEGMELFRALSKKYPETYEICANTAVAYELNGKIDSAIYWEKNAIRLRPNAHGGSEWIHLKILEAKKQLESNADWCLYNSITHIVDSVKKYPMAKYEGYGKAESFLEQFIDQLEERLPFTYGEDKVLGKLLMELGDAYQQMSIFRAYYCYAMARHFYPALDKVVNDKMQQIKNNYPTPAAIAEKGFPRSGKESDRETKRPNDEEVERFILKILNRPAIKKSKNPAISIPLLLSKI